MFTFLTSFFRKPTTKKFIPLDNLYARLVIRTSRLKRLQALQAPEFLIDRENELIAKALKEIRIRHALIREFYSKPLLPD
jgi:hypothetical protein